MSWPMIPETHLIEIMSVDRFPLSDFRGNAHKALCWKPSAAHKHPDRTNMRRAVRCNKTVVPLSPNCNLSVLTTGAIHSLTGCLR